MTPHTQDSRAELDDLFDKHTVALTSYTDTMPDGQSVHITDYDTVVVNALELKADIQAYVAEQVAAQTKNVTRFEVINSQGRALVEHGVNVELSYQDGGSTLKVFLAKPDRDKE